MPLRYFTASIFALTIVLAISARAQAPDGERKIRDVTPKNIPVIILPPRPENKSNLNPAANEPPIAGDEIQAAVSDDGIISASGKTLRLFGVNTVANDALCETPAGSRWACGLRAHVALRNFVHNKRIKCETLSENSAGPILRCYRERINISEWLLAEGWALYDEAAKDEALAAAARDAEKNARGIWANGSRLIPAKK